jgi:hypothetical protein
MTWEIFGYRLGARHLSDEQLLTAWQDGEADPHLFACASCQARSQALRGFLESIRDEAATAADEVFTPEKLAEQHAHIMRRLDRTLHPARVLAFPALTAATPVGHTVARQWVALAAAAGLVIGVAAGVAVDRRPAPERAGTTSALASPSFVERTSFNDEAFLSDLETAASAPRVEALQAIDAVTPHVREASNTLIR